MTDLPHRILSTFPRDSKRVPEFVFDPRHEFYEAGDEADRLEKILRGKPIKDLETEILKSLNGGGIPALTDQAFLYYLPFFLLGILQQPGCSFTRSMIHSLVYMKEYRPGIPSRLTSEQRAIVRDLLTRSLEHDFEGMLDHPRVVADLNRVEAAWSS